jgi:hypothetical protein
MSQPIDVKFREVRPPRKRPEWLPNSDDLVHLGEALILVGAPIALILLLG